MSQRIKRIIPFITVGGVLVSLTMILVMNFSDTKMNTLAAEQTSALEVVEEVLETKVTKSSTTEKETVTEEVTVTEVTESSTTEKETTTEGVTETKVTESSTTEKEIATEKVAETKVTEPSTTEKEIVTEEVTETKVTEPSTTEKESVTEVVEEITTEKENVTKEETVILELSDVKKALEEKLQENNFDETCKEKICEIFDRVSKNYDSYNILYTFSGIPAKEDYLMEHLVKPLDNISKLNLLDYNSEEAKNLLNEGNSIGWLNPIDYSITYMYKNDINDAELLFHEISHAQNKAQIASPEFNSYKYEIFIEGHATHHQQFTNQCISEVGGAEILTNSKGNAIYYNKNNGLGYTQNYNVYSNLLLIAGVDVMENVTEKADISYLVNALNEKYSADVASRIIDSMQHVTIDELDSETRYESSVKFQNAIIDALCIMVDKLNTIEDVEKFTNMYKAYQNTLLPRVYESDDMYNSEELTYKVFNLSKLERKLVQKNIEFDLVNGHFSVEEEKAILSAILFSSGKTYQIHGEEYFKVLHLPTTCNGIVLNNVVACNDTKFVNITYKDILYNNVTVTMQYVLNDEYEVIEVFNTEMYY